MGTCQSSNPPKQTAQATKQNKGSRSTSPKQKTVAKSNTDKGTLANSNPTERKQESKKKKDSSASGESTPEQPELILGPKLSKRFEVKGFLGSGEYASVFLALDGENGQQKVALKCIHSAKCPKREVEQFKKEVNIMKQLSHPYILKFVDYVEEDFNNGTRMCLVTEHIEGGDLLDSIAKAQMYSEDDVVHIVKQVAQALEYIHQKGVVHRDIKPSNILCQGVLSEKNWAARTVSLKVADFGFAAQMENKDVPSLTSIAGTPLYVAPEIVKASEAHKGGTIKPYGTAVDMWSLGVIMYIMLCGYPPFFNEDPKKLFDAIKSGIFAFPDAQWGQVSAGGKEVIMRLLEVDPSKRMTAAELLAHEWTSAQLPRLSLLKTVESIRSMRAQRLWQRGVWRVRMVVYLKMQRSALGNMGFSSSWNNINASLPELKN